MSSPFEESAAASTPPAKSAPAPNMPPAGGRDLAAPDPLVGTRVLKYDIVRIIGRGGMGTVYEALNTDIGKRVAMKFIDAETVQNADAVARFQREAQAASAVESAHIVEIFDAGMSEQGQPYIVMELLRGEDLGHRIKRCGRLELAEAVHVTAQLLRGLHRAHKAGIVHRDLKPDNVFLVDRDDDPNFVKLLDFGISKVRRQGETPINTLTRQGTVLGTPFYMSPEQAQAQPDVDARSDLWSVGAILFECLAGRPPYTGATYEQVIVNICMNDADDVRTYNPAVPEGVAEVLATALARDRRDRFEDARGFLDALRAATGALISSRGAMLEDGIASDPSQPSPSTTPSARRGSSRMSDPALDPTVRFHSARPLDPRSVGWRRNAAAEQRRILLIVAVSALLLGGLGAFVGTKLMPRTSRTEVAAHTDNAPRTTQTTVATLPGSSEDPGAAPQPATSTAAVVASAKGAPVVTPAPSATPTADHKHPTPPPSAKAEPSDTAAPPTTGVAPTLKLKRY